MILIFCAPSGSGKSTFVKYLLDRYTNFELSISATSRPPRGQEVNGREYYFLSAEQFKQKIAAGDFVEYQEVYTNYFYGTLKSEIERIESKGHHVVFDVDVVGGLNLKHLFGDKAVSIFVQPPSIEALRERLLGRGTDSMEMIQQRLNKASKELSYAPQFEVRIVNDQLPVALQDLEHVLDAYAIRRDHL